MEPTPIGLYEFLVESELQHYYNAIKNELKITNATQFKYATDEDLRTIGLSRPEIRRLRKFYEKHFPHGYLSKIKRLLNAPTAIVKRDEVTLQSNNAASSPEAVAAASANAANSPSKVPNNKHIIPADAISVNKELGTGEFGVVQQGVWTNGTDRIQVAIKCLCRERMQSNPMEFLKEAAIMHSIEHENIVRLYGVVLATDSLMLVTELAHLRSLLECLKDSGLRVSFLTVPTLCEFAVQICNGMKYLENKRLIHRDLAARNILVFNKNKVKISDFGLSRALGVGKDYYKTNFNVNLKLPIAWCAPECINYLRFTNASDVWAFGVCLWEMFSYGFQPWAALTGLQILEAIDAPNYQRLEQPDCCPREYYNLMLKCWQDDPLKRPKFSEIYEILPELKPEQLKTVVNNCESKKPDFLLYRQGDIITVLDRNTGTPFWKGVLNSGKIGYFNPSNTVAYLEGLPCSNRDSFHRASERSSKRKLRTEMISKPQNDLKHTGHVGIDGASFGNVAFLGNSQSYNYVPRQIVTPYKPSEDIEQTPLLLPPTPTSPDSLQTASGYFPEESSATSTNLSFLPSTENTPKHLAIAGQNSFDFSDRQTKMLMGNPFTSGRCDDERNAHAMLAMQNNNYGTGDQNRDSMFFNHELEHQGKVAGKNSQEQHEYHEISDDEIAEDKLDLGPSLLDEINSMIGSMTMASAPANHHVNTLEMEHASSMSKKSDGIEAGAKFVRKNGIDDTNGNKFGASFTKKKTAGTVKPISVKDERILNQAIEIANEISARSMTDLVSEQPAPSTQSPKRKFSFRFSHLTNNGANDKSSNGTAAAGAAGGNYAKYGSTAHSKNKNFTEELKSIPDLQRFRSLSQMPSGDQDSNLPLFDKQSSDFLFEKSRELLSRPLGFELPAELQATGAAYGGSFTDAGPMNDRKSFSENIIDIENTLKALNLDFMHTFSQLEKTDDSDDALLNPSFSDVNPFDEKFDTTSLKGLNYKSSMQETVFNFDAATNHIEKHLQYMNSLAHNMQPLEAMHEQHKSNEDKRSSTPDTGFASRDTNMSLSRRSSQKSSYSPQEAYFSPRDKIPNPLDNGYMGLKEEYAVARKSTNHAAGASSSFFPANELKSNGDFHYKSKGFRHRSMSFASSFNPISPVLSEPQQRPKRQPTKLDQVQVQHKLNGAFMRSSSYKPRSVRARTLRRLSYNPIMLITTSSSSSESESNSGIARSECDIRSRMSSLRRRRYHQRLMRNTLPTNSAHDEAEFTGLHAMGLYGSNASIKSAPHYNYPATSLTSLRNAPRKQQQNDVPYEERIYDFGGQNKSYNNASSRQSPSLVPYANSNANANGAKRNTAILNDFDVTRLTGKSPTSSYVSLSPEERNLVRQNPPNTLPLPMLNTQPNNKTASSSTKTTHRHSAKDFQWPESIHVSTVKQNDLFWQHRHRQEPPSKQHQQQKQNAGPHRTLSDLYRNQSSDSSSTPDSDDYQFQARAAEFIPHIPPSPAP